MKEYKCKYCGKCFDKAYSVAAHTSNCKCNPNYDLNVKARISSKESLSKRTETRKQNNPDKYFKKEFIIKCPKCNKIFSVYITQNAYDKGNYTHFCSRKCANSHKHSEETKEKIKNGVLNSPKYWEGVRIALQKRQHVYNTIDEIPQTGICKICGKSFFQRYKQLYDGTYIICGREKYCSDECRHINSRIINHQKHTGGFKEGSVKNYKSGWYHGIHCDSSWELAFIIYCEEHNFVIKRCKECRFYKLDNIEKKFYPDFIVNDVIYEIKGIKSNESDAKQVYNKDVVFLYREDMKKYLDYVISKYGKDFISLYEHKDK